MFESESETVAGLIEFFILDNSGAYTQCPDTSGVGVDAVGGVFNCGLAGVGFKAECTTPCSNNVTIIELFLWKHQVLSLPSTYGVGYTLEKEQMELNEEDGNREKLFALGTYFQADADWSDLFYVSRKGEEG